jgi:hypothetical protein
MTQDNFNEVARVNEKPDNLFMISGDESSRNRGSGNK